MLFNITALEETTDAISVSDTDGRSTYHNATFVERFGYTPDELDAAGGPVTIFYDERLGHSVWQELRHGRSWSGEVELQTRDGIILPTLFRADTLTDETGSPTGIISICTDITDRKLAEILLKESEERYRAVVEDQTELICRFDTEGSITFVNRAIAEYFSKRPADLLESPWWDLIPANRRRFVRSILRSLSPEAPYDSFEVSLPRMNDAHHWHQWTVRALFDDRNELLEYQAVGRDVTDKKLASEALRASEEEHRFISEHVADMIARHDRQGRYLFCSRASERLFGYHPHELIGQSAYHLIHPEDVNRLRMEHAGLIGERSVVTSEFRFRKKDGSYVWVETSVRSVRNSRKKIIEFLSATRDITQRKKLEAKRAHRLRVEDALLRVSRLLISSTMADYAEVLQTIGEAVEARRVSLYHVIEEGEEYRVQLGGCYGTGEHDPSNTTAEQLLSRDQRWIAERLKHGFVVATRVTYGGNGRAGTDAVTPVDNRPVVLLIPILSEQSRLMGYVEFDTSYPSFMWPTEDIRILCVLGDMLASYLERNKYEQALQASEERYRTFVTTISEAIWSFELPEPMALDCDAEFGLQYISRHAILAECNEVFSDLMIGCSPTDALGKPLSSLFICTANDLIKDFIRNDYRIKNGEYALRDSTGEIRNFIINVVGIVEDGHLMRAWGSQIDITPQVDLKKSMVSALEDQQQRIGHDLHDGVGPYLTSIRMLSDNLADKLRQQKRPESVQAQKIATLSHEATQSVRKIYRGLTPLQLYKEGLVMALQDIANTVNDLPDLSCAFERDETIDIYDNKTKVHLYRIAQEAVNNALKHGKPRKISISLKNSSDRYRLEVLDDGTGFDPANVTGTTLGVSGMYFRARMMNAELTIDSEPEKGTSVTCVVKNSTSQP